MGRIARVAWWNLLLLGMVSRIVWRSPISGRITITWVAWRHLGRLLGWVTITSVGVCRRSSRSKGVKTTCGRSSRGWGHVTGRTCRVKGIQTVASHCWCSRRTQKVVKCREILGRSRGSGLRSGGIERGGRGRGCARHRG